MRSRKILPLETRLGELLLHSLHELIYKIKISLSRDSFVSPAKVFGILEPVGVVGADIQYDRECPRRMYAADKRVQRELSDRNPETTCPLITDAQNTLAIGDDDDIHLLVWPISQECRDGVAKRIRDKQ